MMLYLLMLQLKSTVSYEDMIRTLGTFRDTESFIIGTKSWNQVTKL